MHSYPSIYNFGHRVLKGLFDDPVLIQEKVDGSQFSFGRFDGVLKARSRGQELIINAPENMFAKAVEVISELPLKDGWTYRGEYLQKPKHNALAYSRVPKNHIILFDINTGLETYAPWETVEMEAARLGLECVPVVYSGMWSGGIEEFKAVIDRESVLGGAKVEGVVVKNYHKFGPDKKALMAKYVSEAFKEIHTKEWGKSNPGTKEVIARLIEKYKTEARWQKALQHCRERGEITDTPADIGALIKEVNADIPEECEEAIKEELYKYALPHILRGCTSGLPQWYKDYLMESTFA